MYVPTTILGTSNFMALPLHSLWCLVSRRLTANVALFVTASNFLPGSLAANAVFLQILVLDLHSFGSFHGHTYDRREPAVSYE